MSVPVFAAGNYRYIKAFFQYSAGVAAEPGYEIERARFAAPLPPPTRMRRLKRT